MMPQMVAALYVEKNGPYYGLPDVDPWDKERDARNYAGPFPVVAHPPCQRWGRFAKQVEAVHGHQVGDDGGCFAAALTAVRAFGGVIEHPAYSLAFPTFGLPEPATDEGWTLGFCGGWSCYVEQGRYGHPVKKATWLYIYGVADPPAVRWGKTADQDTDAAFRWASVRYAGDTAKHRLSSQWNARTPDAFRDALLGIARSVDPLTTLRHAVRQYAAGGSTT